VKRLPDSIAVIILLVGLALVAARLLAGCAAGLDVGAHSAALTECRAKGKDAGSYAVYAACADEADRKYIPDGGAP
jgi:hypothetical protein